MGTYQISEPPAEARCCLPGCASLAVVRGGCLEPGGAAKGEGPRDYEDWCDLDWPNVRRTLVTTGATIADATGDLAVVKAAYPGWHIWPSDVGRLYASARLCGLGMTVDAWLLGPLAGQMAEQEQRAARGVR